MAALASNEPQAIAAIRAKAAKVPNGKGLLWKIEKDGRSSYLFGTMHMTDPRVTTLTPAARKAFDGIGNRRDRDDGRARPNPDDSRAHAEAGADHVYRRHDAGLAVAAGGSEA